jgi:hypothetical protein
MMNSNDSCAIKKNARWTFDRQAAGGLDTASLLQSIVRALEFLMTRPSVGPMMKRHSFMFPANSVMKWDDLNWVEATKSWVCMIPTFTAPKGAKGKKAPIDIIIPIKLLRYWPREVHVLRNSESTILSQVLLRPMPQLRVKVDSFAQLKLSSTSGALSYIGLCWEIDPHSSLDTDQIMWQVRSTMMQTNIERIFVSSVCNRKGKREERVRFLLRSKLAAVDWTDGPTPHFVEGDESPDRAGDSELFDILTLLRADVFIAIASPAAGIINAVRAEIMGRVNSSTILDLTKP